MMMTAGVEQCGRSWPLFCSTVRCSAFACSCPSFTPGSVQVRSCDLCGHGWVAHALEKLPPPPSSGPVEVVFPGLVFDLGALVLYRAQAVPVRLKILLDRLFSVLAPDQVSSILHSLGWSLGDYVRGYMLQGPGGKVLDRWVMVTPEEELLLFKQFRRFGETRPIVELMMPHSLDTTKHPSGPEAKCASKSSQHNLRNHEPALVRLKSTQECSGLLEDNDSSNYFENVPGGLPSLLPFHSQRSELCSSGPSVKERVPFRNLMKVIPEFFPTKPIEKNKPETARLKVHQDLLLHQSKDRSTLKIKTDPDGLRQTQPLWHPNKDHELHLHSGAPGNDGASPFSPFIPSLAPSSSSFSPSIPSSSSSPLQMSQKLQKSPSSPLQPLPSFSSFFCPSSSSSTSTSLHPVPFLSSQLQPLPTSLCSFSLPLSAGGRKGRVHCGVCEKSFYDKGTLKIHYNAVHLKIKHRCTVAGCTMVFSSLRSRNRHSSNPNPRLHTGTHRDAHRDPPIPHGKNTIFQEERLFREGDFRKPSWFCGFDAPTTKKAPIRNKLEADTNTHHGANCDPPTNITRPPALMQDTNCVFILNRPQTPPPSPPTAPLDSPPSCFSLGCNGHLGSEDFCCSLTSPACGQPSAGSLPKKKPRKSSMPVKIEREMPARRRLQDEEETPG